jgi:alcohol dehydrogenase (cytochrome c)
MARTNVLTLAVSALALLSPPNRLVAQGVTDAMLVHPLPDSWPGYHGDYSGRRHSELAQITPRNVHELSLAWAFQSEQPASIKASPLLVDGIIYLTAIDNVWAVDARTGHPIWRYTYPPNKGGTIGQRGVAMYHDSLYYLSPDAYLVCLNAKDGKQRWKVEVADSDKGYWSTAAPVIVGNHVIVGVGGDSDNIQGFLKSMDANTGAVQWEWDSTPPTGTANATTGGMTWIPGTYDPELNLLYWGTGNPTPVLNGAVRPGNDLYTCSIVALSPDTGKLVWSFQPSPHDTHDWDAVEIPVLVDGVFHGKPRKMLMQASRNGYFFVLDRITGESLLAVPFGPTNWALGIDKKGQPIPNPEKDPAPDGRLVAPDEGGLTNYRSPSFDPKTGLFIVSASISYGIYFTKPEDGTWGWAGADYGVVERGVLDAIDYQTGKIRWAHRLGFFDNSDAGVLTTGSGLIFTGDATGNMLALDTATGKTLWHAGLGADIETSPTTYELDGRQYVLVGAGQTLFAWALPEGSNL